MFISRLSALRNLVVNLINTDSIQRSGQLLRKPCWHCRSVVNRRTTHDSRALQVGEPHLCRVFRHPLVVRRCTVRRSGEGFVLPRSLLEVTVSVTDNLSNRDNLYGYWA